MMEEKKINTDAAAETAESKQEQPEKEYHDIFWYAIQSIKENALQTTYQPPSDAPEGCQGGCATCGFKCAHAGIKRSEYDKPTSNDPYGERNHVDISEAPAPETTFPLLQVLACVVACIAGCYLANGFFMSILS